jgi:hypothetical protein
MSNEMPKVLMLTGEIIDYKDIPEQYRNDKYVLSWSDSKKMYLLKPNVGNVGTERFSR